MWVVEVYKSDMNDTLLLRLECYQPDAAFAIEQAAKVIRHSFSSHNHIHRIVVWHKS